MFSKWQPWWVGGMGGLIHRRPVKPTVSKLLKDMKEVVGNHVDLSMYQKIIQINEKF